jgi:DNA-binding MurR/RpiR family transcriptional regulator
MQNLITKQKSFQFDNMTYEERIRAAYPGFSKSFIRLADFILDSYLEAAFMTATELGHAVNVDATTVVRFSQQLGYAGYPELLREIRDKIKSQLLSQPQNAANADSIEGVLESAMSELDSLFEQTRRLLEPNKIFILLEYIRQSDKIVLIPDAHARPAAYTLRNIFERGQFQVSQSETGAMDLARTLRNANEKTLLIALETGAESGHIAAALREAQQAGIRTSAILSAASLPCAQTAELVLFAHSQPTLEMGVMLLNAIAYAIGHALRWRFPERYSGADQKVDDLVARIQEPVA